MAVDLYGFLRERERGKSPTREMGKPAVQSIKSRYSLQPDFRRSDEFQSSIYILGIGRRIIMSRIQKKILLISPAKRTHNARYCVYLYTREKRSRDGQIYSLYCLRVDLIDSCMHAIHFCNLLVYMR
jgi:hypothetical protein